jgi:hypothetical protein
MTVRSYSSPEAFKQALEQRLRTLEKTGAEMARRRQLLVFDRFLARIVAVLGDAATLKGGLALEQTFTFRETHSLPDMLPAPLSAWEAPYAAMASEDQLAWPTLDDVTRAAQAFLGPVLAGSLDAIWEPEAA